MSHESVKIHESEKTDGRDRAPSVSHSNIIQGQSEPVSSGTQRRLKSRHLQMIAIGGSVGTGLFVGAGRTLSRGGPAFTLAAFVLISAVVWVFSTIVIEMVSYLPLDGATPNYFTSRYVSKSLGFAMGWTYWYVYAILVPYEVTAAALIIEYWNPPVHNAIFITIFLVVIVILNFLPVGVYGEAEFYFSWLKILLILGTIMLAIVIALGGGPSGDRIGFRYWNDPGPVNAWILDGAIGKFVSFLGTIVSVVLPFTFCVEMLATCGGESKNPRKSLPSAGKTFIYRLLVFYILSILAITILCPSNAPELTSGGADAGASPYVVGIKKAGIKVLDHIINGVILSSAWSAGNVFLYLASRSLYSMAIEGSAPKFFSTTNRWGVPYWSVSCCSLIGLLAYLNTSSQAGVVFNWLVNMINMGAFFSWVFVSFTYIRFRTAFELQGFELESLPYVSVCGKPGAYLCIVFFGIIGLLNGFYVFFPSMWSVSNFMTAYVGVLLFAIFYFGHRLTIGRKDPWIVRLEDMDLVSGLDAVDEATTFDEETSRVKTFCNRVKSGTRRVFTRAS